jgi:uroporphyrinogen decarboxylase
VPRGEIVIDDSVVQSFLRCGQAAFEERLEFVKALGLDLICLEPTFPSKPAGIVLPDPSQAVWRNLDDWAGKTDRFIVAVLDGAFEWGIRLWGFQKFMIILIRGGSGLTDFVTAVGALNVILARQVKDRGAAAILLADDIAYQQGLMASPDLLRRYILPSLTHQAEIFRAMNLPVFFHSDGNLNGILNDIAMAGLDGLQCLEAAAGMDLGSIRERYGARLCLWGNLDPIYLTSLRSREEIVQQVASILQAAGQRGCFVFGTSSGLFKGMRPENLQWVYGALDKAV